MKRISFFSIMFSCCSFFAGCQAQQKDRTPAPGPVSRVVGGACEDCDLMYINMPEKIDSASVSPGWNEPGRKLIVTGTVFQKDGKTPAPDIVIYYWQTDNNGFYSPSPSSDKQAARHGHIRGWIKTNASGKYMIRTIRPAAYPKRDIPAHIHFLIREPDLPNEYYPDDLNFDDDKLLLPYMKRHPAENRGGSGVVRVLLKDSLQIAEHNFILGLNIPGYPQKNPRETNNGHQQSAGKTSGLNIGEDQPSFTPFHAYGPDKGSRTCPVCKYGRYHGIIYYVGNQPDWQEIKQWLKFLEAESYRRQKYLKVYFVYGNDKHYSRQNRLELLEKIGEELSIRFTALTFVPSFTDKETDIVLNRIDPEVSNTLIIFKHSNIVDKYIDLRASRENFDKLVDALDRTKGDYFHLTSL